MLSLWWLWAIGGIALILAELAVPAFVLIWFGLGALVVALVELVGPGFSLTTQFATWLVVSLALVFLWFKIFKPGFFKTRVGLSDTAAIGEVGILTKEVAPFQKGEVRFQKPTLGSDVWACISDEPLSGGTRVRVLSVEGSLLKVGRAAGTAHEQGVGT